MSKSPSDLRQVVNGSPLRRPMVASCLKSIGAPGGELRETVQVVHEFVWKKTRDVLTCVDIVVHASVVACKRGLLC